MRRMLSYFESRGGAYAHVPFFGLQYYLEEYLSQGVTPENVFAARDFFQPHGVTFNFTGWMDIATRGRGKIPLAIRALPEGTVVQTRVPLMVVESTNPNHPWVVNWFETVLSRLWYPITVAAASMYLKKSIKYYMNETCDTLDKLPFMLHDFGARGVSSAESAEIGGAAHLLSFQGSDTCEAAAFLQDYYGPFTGPASFALDAMEHSTVSSWGDTREAEVAAYRNMLTVLGTKGRVIACVSDTRDIFAACQEIWGKELKQEVIDSGATVVIRPDSGDPLEVVMKVLEILEEQFGSTENSKGCRVLKNVRVIQGDGMTPDMITSILDKMERNWWSADNIAFGMGGKLLQDWTRDTNSFAYKCCEVTRIIDGVKTNQPVYKNPITDTGKKSLAGNLDTFTDGEGGYCVVYRNSDDGDLLPSALVPVFWNGDILTRSTLPQIRERIDTWVNK